MVRVMQHKILRGVIARSSYDLFLNLENCRGREVARATGIHGTCSLGSLIYF